MFLIIAFGKSFKNIAPIFFHWTFFVMNTNLEHDLLIFLWFEKKGNLEVILFSGFYSIINWLNMI